MKPLETQMEEVDRWDYMHKNVTYKDNVVDKDNNLLKTASLHNHYSNSQELVQVVVKHHILN